MDAMAYPTFDTRTGVIVGRMHRYVAVRLENDGVRLAPVIGTAWEAGQRVEVLLRQGFDRALAVRSLQSVRPASWPAAHA
jgi:hypothetical protein